MDLSDPGLLKLEPKDIPCECDVIIYTRFSIDLKSRLNIDKGSYVWYYVITYNF
jgi:hypothetical protein